MIYPKRLIKFIFTKLVHEKILFKTLYNIKYSNNVSESSNKIHLYPYNENTQQIINHRITVSGNPIISTYLDDYNNMVGYFNHLPPHKYLMIQLLLLKSQCFEEFFLNIYQHS